MPVKFFKSYIAGFEQKLEMVNIEVISTEPYCRKYLSHLLQHKTYYLHIYADVLNKLCGNAAQDIKSIRLIDYGAGNGLLGLFAKYCGFGSVILVDIDQKFMEAAAELSTQLNIAIDDFITGDLESIGHTPVLQNVHAIIGTDVIEHIYNLENFFQTIASLNKQLAFVFTTASNPANKLKVRAIKKMQLKDELEGGEPTDHLLFGDSALEPFLITRRKIISRLQKHLDEHTLQQLATATRGMNKDDIVKAVELFIELKKWPEPASGSNTCNPVNGSWTERILSFDEYKSLCNAAGFTCKFYPGFYNQYEGGIGANAKKMLNTINSIAGNKISPYIVIAGNKK